MSAAMGSDTRAEKVYVELLDEGVFCLRPTLAQPLGEGKYRLLRPDDYDPQDEHWAFPPGSVVKCRIEQRYGGQMLVAYERVEQQ